jgi:hypothetical protein
MKVQAEIGVYLMWLIYLLEQVIQRMGQQMQVTSTTVIV